MKTEKISADNCNNCGLCCYLPMNGVIARKKCKYLRFRDDDTSYCVRYSARLGSIMGSGILNGKRVLYVCGHRYQALFDYPGCPNNCGRELIKVEIPKRD